MKIRDNILPIFIVVMAIIAFLAVGNADSADGLTEVGSGGGGTWNYSTIYYGHSRNTTTAHDLNTYQFVCTVNAITNYTFDGTESRNAGYGVNTATGSKTVNIDPDLFSTGTEFSICKSTSDANTVTLDSGAGNTIDGSQTYVLQTYNQVVTLIRSAANTWKVKSGFLENSAVLNNHTGNTTNAHGINNFLLLSGTRSMTGNFHGNDTSSTIGGFRSISTIGGKFYVDTDGCIYACSGRFFLEEPGNAIKFTLLGDTPGIQASMVFSGYSGTQSNISFKRRLANGTDENLYVLSVSGIDRHLYLKDITDGHYPLSLVPSGTFQFHNNASLTTYAFGLQMSGKIEMASGTNKPLGSGVLSSGAVTVNNTQITANTKIMFSVSGSTTNAGIITITAQSSGSATFTSSNGADDRTINYVLFEPL